MLDLPVLYDAPPLLCLGCQRPETRRKEEEVVQAIRLVKAAHRLYVRLNSLYEIAWRCGNWKAVDRLPSLWRDAWQLLLVRDALLNRLCEERGTCRFCGGWL